MQLYAGLPIITNKITEEERKGIPHHLLGCIQLDEQTWTVGNFITSALEKIKEIRSRGRLPILVGGTHYYTQSLLFHDALTKQDHETDIEKEANESTDHNWPILEGPTEDMLSELRKVDPTMADRWHPNDRRKIRRSLEIYLQTNRKASDIYAEQRERKAMAVTGSSPTDNNETDVFDSPSSLLRMDTLIFWVHASTTTLPNRLDTRVDKMLASGLLSEVSTLSAYAAHSPHAIDPTTGIWVAIGYKEFLAYHTGLQSGDTPAIGLESLRLEAIEKTKTATRRYAKSQVRWIRIKLLNAIVSAGASDRFFLLDGSHLETWDTDVSDKSLEIVGKYIEDQRLPDPAGMSELAAEMLVPKRSDMSVDAGKWERRFCEACGMTAVTESDWVQHVKSRRHRRVVAKKAKGDYTGDRKERRRPADDELEDEGDITARE